MSAATPTAVATQFYQAFAARDFTTMGALYADDATFGDPAFPDLKGEEIRQMWKMLLTRGKDLRIEFTVTGAEGDVVKVHWTAWYTFSQTGRAVQNEIDATLTVRDGLIVTHRDHFDLWKWSAQALGPVGSLLGWSSLVRNKVQMTASKGLKQFMGK